MRCQAGRHTLPAGAQTRRITPGSIHSLPPSDTASPARRPADGSTRSRSNLASGSSGATSPRRGMEAVRTARSRTRRPPTRRRLANGQASTETSSCPTRRPAQPTRRIARGPLGCRWATEASASTRRGPWARMLPTGPTGLTALKIRLSALNGTGAARGARRITRTCQVLT